MTLVELLFSTLTEPSTWIALALGLSTAYLIQFWKRVRELPPGPTPLPIIGNLLQLREESPLYEKAVNWTKQYGDPITVWVGHRPFVVVSSKESFKEIAGPLRNLVAGRNPTEMGRMLSRGFEDVAFGDFSPSWDVLRRLAHTAMRKFSTTEKLADLVADTVDDELEHVFGSSDECRYGVFDFVEDIINNILAVSSFGEGFKRGDSMYETMREATAEFESNTRSGLPSDIMPILRYVFYKQEGSARAAFQKLQGIIDAMFAQAKQTWSAGKSRHFTDVLLNAREEFLAEDRDSAKYLIDNNVRQVITEIFGAGTGTSRTILSYCCIRLANDPKLQEELRSEIIEEIGSNKCTYDDRARLPKCDSFLQEVVRYYPAVPLSLPRKAMKDVTINGRFVPGNLDLLINVHAVNRDEAIWGPDAREFNPKRFLNASKDQQARGFNSFGIGARSCPGEKLAQSDMFYALVRTLQGAELKCVGGPGTAVVEKKDTVILLDVPRQNLIFRKHVQA